jgi:hypothetical protein
MKNILRLSLLSLAAALLLSACRADENSDSNATAQITTVGQAILAAEANGTIPKLNHDDTIAGPDTDGNGIRDDIDAYIATLPYTEVQKKAVKQHAKALSASLTVDTTDKTALAKVADDMSRASWCVYTKLSDSTPSKIKSDNEKMIVNTKNRFLQYEKFNSALSGGVFASPGGDGCDN